MIFRSCTSMLAVMLIAASAQAQQSDTTLVSATIANPSEVADEVSRWYPDRLRQLGVRGTTIYKLNVDADGKIRERRLFASSGVRAFDRAAARAIQKVKVHPAKRNGVAVASVLTLPVRFEGDVQPGVTQLGRATLLNLDSAVAMAAAQFPKNQRDDRINVYASVVLEIGEGGVVRAVALSESTCFPAIDDLIKRVGATLRIADAPRGISYLNVLFAFKRDSLKLTAAGDTIVQDTSARNPPRPDLPGVAIKPQLINREAVGRELTRRYPDDLKRHGLGGEAVVWMLIDEKGNVASREIANTSGNCDIDVAALQVSRIARFEPALVGGKPLKVWIQLPVTFRSTR